MTFYILDLESKREAYDHRALAEAAMRTPGEWMTDNEPMPQIRLDNVRRGELSAYRPAGAFTVRRLRREGRERFAVKYLGVPQQPWSPPSDGRAFGDLLRTTDPDRMPEGTPEHVVEVARGLLGEAIAQAERKRKKRKKKPRGGAK